MTPPSRFARLFDLFLLGLAGLFAVLVASFVARNSDLWLHLATGRLIAQGKYDFATDPFSYATEGVPWVNHAWLTDWLAYRWWVMWDESNWWDWWLVGLKAMLVAGTVVVALSGIRREQSRWAVALLAVVCVAALAPRVTLQPFVISVALLAVLLRLLQTGGRGYLAVPVLVAIWANLDEWFVLGPVVTFVHWACCRWKKTRPVPHWLPVAAVAACLLTPFHVFGFTLPTELSPAFWASEFARDPRIAPQYASPFVNAPLDAVSFWAFAVLLVGGIALLVVRRRQVNLWEAVTWGVFAALGVWQSRLVPFLAVASLTVFAPHLQELTAVFDRRRVRWLVRLVAFATLIAFGVTSWTGWLNGARGRDRVFGWAVWLDGTADVVAVPLHRWREDGKLPTDAHTLVTSPDTTNLLYWANPDERGYLDTRWELHARAGNGDGLRAADRLGLTDGGKALPDAALLERYRVAAVCWSNPPPVALASVASAESGWRVVAVTARSVWLARKGDPTMTQPDLDTDWFPHPHSLSETGKGPDTDLPGTPPWWAPPGGVRTLVAGAEFAPPRPYLVLAAQAQSVPMAMTAVRDSRELISSGTDTPQAWFALARSVAVVQGIEARLAPQSGLFAELRRVQQVTALQQAVNAQPEYEAGHAALAAVLTEVGYWDRALAERRAELALARRRGDGDKCAALGEVVRGLEDTLFDRESLFQVQTQKMSGDPLGRARIALGLGLADLARDTLVKANSDLYGADGLKVLAGVLVSTGQAREALALLERREFQRGGNVLGLHEVASETVAGQRITYRLPAYDWFRFLLAAAVGRREVFDHLKDIRNTLTMELGGVDAFLDKLAGPVANQVVSEVGLGMAAAPLPRLLIAVQEQQLLRPVAQSKLLVAERADLWVLEAAVALEFGEGGVAREAMLAAQPDYEASKGLGVAPAKPLLEVYRKLARER